MAVRIWFHPESDIFLAGEERTRELGVVTDGAAVLRHSGSERRKIVRWKYGGFRQVTGYGVRREVVASAGRTVRGREEEGKNGGDGEVRPVVMSWFSGRVEELVGGVRREKWRC
ncbi:hypothetical protein HAX54_027939 [Datura stramonium]|uniref:Cyclic nucleotide-binding domain-containing protein n=1 Tax=Datura stramonium TaxID=4076 RepID=A0ABS8V5J2_DATST|nr:hypothetical protein [Datura stramonium]